MPDAQPTKRPRVDDGTAAIPSETVRLRDETHDASLRVGLTRLWRDGNCDITTRVVIGACMMRAHAAAKLTRRMPDSQPMKRPRVEDGTAAAPAETYRLRGMHGARFRAKVCRLWGTALLRKSCDITIRVPTGLGYGTVSAAGTSVATADVKAHRVVLAAMSEPLDRMISGPMASVDENNVLTLTGISPAALRSVMMYAYNGSLEFTQDTVWGVLQACIYLELDRATQLCTNFLCEQLTPANALGLAKTAVALHCAELEAAALAFAEANMTAVSEGAEWLEMPLEEAVSLACETHPLLSRVVPHSVVLKALGRWVEFVPKEWRQWVNLGPDERRAEFVQRERWAAFEKRMARRGALAQCSLGLCYKHGFGVARDLGKAVEWWTKAANLHQPGTARGPIQ